MAYTEARSGLARSNAFHAGLVPVNVTISIDGTDRTRREPADLSIQLNTSAYSSCSFSLRGLEPPIGKRVLVTWQTPGVYLFAGTIIRVTAQAHDAHRQPVWFVECVDDVWLLDRYALVNRRFDNVGVNTAIWQVLEEFTDGGFTLGGGLGVSAEAQVSIEFVNTRVSDAVLQLAAAIKAGFVMNPDRSLSLWSSAGAPGAWWVPRVIDLDGAMGTSELWNFRYTRDMSQVRTSAIAEGGASQVAVTAAAGATTLNVSPHGQFSAAGGAGRVGANLFTYTGLEQTTDADGNVVTRLTGVSGLTRDVPIGATVVPRSTADDATTETNLATLLGGGLSGVAVSLFGHKAVGQDLAEAYAEDDVNRYAGSGFIEQYEFDTELVTAMPGAAFNPTLTSPFIIYNGVQPVVSVQLSRVRRNGADTFVRHCVVTQQQSNFETEYSQGRLASEAAR